MTFSQPLDAAAAPSTRKNTAARRSRGCPQTSTMVAPTQTRTQQRPRYNEEDLQGLTLMSDPRVIRGSTHSLYRDDSLPAAGSALDAVARRRPPQRQRSTNGAHGRRTSTWRRDTQRCSRHCPSRRSPHRRGARAHHAPSQRHMQVPCRSRALCTTRAQRAPRRRREKSPASTVADESNATPSDHPRVQAAP